MRLIFAGTPEIAAVVLAKLLTTEHEIAAVLTQPDRPAGRGQKVVASPVKTLALAHQIPVYQPDRLKEAAVQETLKNLNVDLMIVVAYGLMVPQSVLEIPRLGCWNVHVSLLPRWRGAAPIQRAIEAGDSVTGVTIMQMDKGLDTGPILLQEAVRIPVDMNAGQLHDVLVERGAACLLQALAQQSELVPMMQPLEGMTYAAKITKEEARIDWAKTAVEIQCQIRAFYPWPVCVMQYQGQMIRVLAARVAEQTAAVPQEKGTLCYVTDTVIGMQTGDGILEILSLQLPGGKALDMKTFLQGHRDFFKAGSSVA